MGQPPVVCVTDGSAIRPAHLFSWRWWDRKDSLVVSASLWECLLINLVIFVHCHDHTVALPETKYVQLGFHKTASCSLSPG